MDRVINELSQSAFFFLHSLVHSLSVALVFLFMDITKNHANNFNLMYFSVDILHKAYHERNLRPATAAHIRLFTTQEKHIWISKMHLKDHLHHIYLPTTRHRRRVPHPHISFINFIAVFTTAQQTHSQHHLSSRSLLAILLPFHLIYKHGFCSVEQSKIVHVCSFCSSCFVSARFLATVIGSFSDWIRQTIRQTLLRHSRKRLKLT